MSSGGAWGAKVWGGSTSTADRDRLPKGDEPCHICGEDAMVEVKLQPCQHEICLGCCNAMRANVVFKVSPSGPLAVPCLQPCARSGQVFELPPPLLAAACRRTPA